MTLRVLHVAKLYYPWIGGVEQAVKDIAEALVRQHGCRVQVLCCAVRGLEQHDVVGEIPVTRCASAGIMLGMPISPSLPFRYQALAPAHDIVHLHMPFPLGAIAGSIDGKRPQAKMIVHYHSDVVRQRWLRRAYVPFLKILLRRADRIIVTSPPLLQSPALAAFAEKCVVRSSPNLGVKVPRRRVAC